MKNALRYVLYFLVFLITVLLFINLDDTKTLKSSLLEKNNFPKLEKAKPIKIEKENIVKSNPSNKTIYLTFDDGPSYLTSEILDILKEKEVPATFFVVGANINKYSDIVKREYVEGHTVAVHSDSHVYGYIYSSLDNYLNDLYSIRNKVHNITKDYPRIVRLPGGSSNMVSKKYKKGVVTEITNWLNQHDYYYFDWNVDSLDASGKVNKDIIYNSVINSIKDGNNIILIHDSSTKRTTVEALPLIIDYAKNNGYTFAKITKNTEVLHHHINN